MALGIRIDSQNGSRASFLANGNHVFWWVLARRSQVQRHNVQQTSDGSKSLLRGTRVVTDVLIEVLGEDFAYAGETITVSLQGALISTSASLKTGMKILLYVHSTGKSGQAHVIFVEGEETKQYGIELDHPDNIWGLSGSPVDWAQIT